MGAALHSLRLGAVLHRGLWVALYALLYLTVWLFYLLLADLFGKTGGRRLPGALGVGLYCAGVAVLLAGVGWDIYIFAAYAGLLLVPSLIRMLADARATPWTRALAAALCLAPAAQALKAVIPGGVVICYIFLVAALWLAYRVAENAAL